MSQHDLNIANQGMAAGRGDLNNALVALASTSKGPSRPSGAVAGQFWIDDDTPSATLWTLMLFDGSDDIPVAYIDSSANIFYAFPVTKQIQGLSIANNGADAANDIDVTPGIARAESNDDSLLLTATLVKRLDAAWAVGTNQGGIDTGAEAASTVYAVWLIKRPDTGVVDALFSTSFTAPTMPTNYTKKRLIGMIRNDAALAISTFVQQGDYFRYTGVLVNDVADATITDDVFETIAIAAPPNSLAHIYVRASSADETAFLMRVHVRRAGSGDTAVTTQATIQLQLSAGAGRDIGKDTMVMTDASRQIDYAANETAGTVTVTVATIGFLMLTRSNP